jgi:peptidoglycan/LPS O-acetylase OafA/YrhL
MFARRILITFRYTYWLQWVRRYVRNRIARIYPMYFLATLATLIGTVLNTRYDASTVWSQYNLKDTLVSFLNFTFLQAIDRYTMVGQDEC